MPEGPSLLIVRENISPFIGKKIIAADGNAKQVAFSKLTGKKYWIYARGASNYSS